nr:MAG TPA: hypothetical protein [Bacteriophage sp.]
MILFIILQQKSLKHKSRTKFLLFFNASKRVVISHYSSISFNLLVLISLLYSYLFYYLA